MSVDVTDPEERITLGSFAMDQWISGFEIGDRFIHVVNWTGEYGMITFDNPAKLEMPEGYGGRIEGYARDVRTAKIRGSSYASVLSNKKWSWPGRLGIGGVVVLDITNP